MLKIKDSILTAEQLKKKQKVLYNDAIKPEKNPDRTYTPDTFMLKKPIKIKKEKLTFKKFDLGKISGNLSREELYEDR